jgi:polar amino acid transport system permease protein
MAAAKRDLAVLLVAAAVLFLLDLGSGFFGRLLAPAGLSGLGARVAVAVVLALILYGNVALLRLLGFWPQVVIVWLELLLLFLAFFASFDLSYTFIYGRVGFLITQGAFTTVYISLAAIAIASVIALLGALARLSRNGFAYAIAGFYISFFRGTPLLLQVYLIYLGLPQLGFVTSAVPSGIAALSLCYGAYMAEIFRAGIQAIPHGQSEAGRALGLRPGVILRKVVLPQAIKIIIPPTGNQFIAMLKDSSLVSVMGVWELMFLARTQGRAEFKNLEMLVTAAIIYWILSAVFEAIQARLESHYRRGDRR